MNDKNTIGYWKSIKLEALTKDEHEMLISSGMMHVIHPESTGIYSEDCISDWDKGEERMNNISSNGNQGYHYSLDTTEGHDGEGYDATEEFDYRVPMSDNPDGIDFKYDKIFNNGKWNHEVGEDYATKIEKVYSGLPKDGMFVDDYVEDLKTKAYDPEEFYSDPLSPNHYNIGDLDIDAIDIIDATLTKEEYIGYLRGNILKYQLRASKKNGTEDLAKADVYSGWLMEALGE